VLFVFTAMLIGACGDGAAEDPHVAPATLERIDGTDLHRIILTPAAAARLGVATEPVQSESTVRKRQFGAEVVHRPDGTDEAPALWMRLALTETERGSLDLDQPGVISSLNGDTTADGLLAEVAHGGAGDGSFDGMYFRVVAGPTVPVGTPLRIELQTGAAERLVIPYGAVVYDPQGQTWTYTNPSSLVYQRHPIAIDYIDGDYAFLLDGPTPGTEVVTVGAGELSGYESGVGR